MKPYDVVEHYEVDKHDGLEVLAHLELDGALRQVEIVDGSDSITIELPEQAKLLEGLQEVLAHLLTRKQSPRCPTHGLEHLVGCPECAPFMPAHNEEPSCNALCPDHPSWSCARPRGHRGRHEGDGGDWHDAGAGAETGGAT